MDEKAMNWDKLLSAERINCDGKSVVDSDDDMRGPFARDYDRVLFSTAFRRLADKTQVFPIPENDHVHCRLTHSIEVASVGRAVAKEVGRYILSNHPALKPKYEASDFGDIVAAACLAHDIGNPPFGHSGEDAIKVFFARWLGKQKFEDKRQQGDLENFDGNPQGFRIISRLQNEKNGGLKLTAATLATFIKYPRPSLGPDSVQPKGKIYEKTGFFQSEQTLFQKVAEIVGLRPQGDDPTVYCRHPLAFLVEAADDVSNFILDLEDAWRLGYVSQKYAIELLKPIADLAAPEPKPTDEKELIISLRARAFRVLRHEIVETFKANYASIIDGTRNFSLIDGKDEPSKAIPSHAAIAEIKKCSRRDIYSHKNVLKIEIPGYQVLSGLLEEILQTIVIDPKDRSQREAKLIKLFGIEDGKEYEAGQPVYERALRASDYVAGMTDSFAISQYQLIKGMKVDPTVK